MANLQDFRDLASQRLKTVDVLMQAKEWGIAAYILGLVLECVLKAASCKALNLAVYPEVGKTKNNEIANYFRTHNFDNLLIVSGTSDLFGLNGKGFNSWSGFTQEYTGIWTSIRYETITQFDERKVRGMYKFLTEQTSGIISLIESEKRW